MLKDAFRTVKKFNFLARRLKLSGFQVDAEQHETAGAGHSGRRDPP